MKSVEWPQTNKDTNIQKTYIQSKNWGNLFLPSIFFIFCFLLKRRFPIGQVYKIMHRNIDMLMNKTFWLVLALSEIWNVLYTSENVLKKIDPRYPQNSRNKWELKDPIHWLTLYYKLCLGFYSLTSRCSLRGVPAAEKGSFWKRAFMKWVHLT